MRDPEFAVILRYCLRFWPMTHADSRICGRTGPGFKSMSDADYSSGFDAHAGGVPKAVAITEEQFKRTVDLMNLTEKEKLTLSYAEAVAPELARAVDKEVNGK